jgi:hypothetical protein
VVHDHARAHDLAAFRERLRELVVVDVPRELADEDRRAFALGLAFRWRGITVRELDLLRRGRRGVLSLALAICRCVQTSVVAFNGRR